MGGDKNEDQENVIIPDIGAGPYWYVDPRASSVPFAGDAPYSGIASPDSERTPPPLIGYVDDFEDSRVNKQDRADLFDQMRFHGMTEPPNMEEHQEEATGTFEIDGLNYILPTQIDGRKLSHDEAIQRFLETGEHLGVFMTDKDAQFFETNYLTPHYQF